MSKIIQFGIAYLHEQQDENDSKIVMDLFNSKIIHIVIMTYDSSYLFKIKANIVFIKEI